MTSINISFIHYTAIRSLLLILSRFIGLPRFSYLPIAGALYNKKAGRRNLKACPPKLGETAYFSLVRSSLEYSSAVWDPFRQKDIDKLEKIQRAAAKFVTQNYRQTASVTSLIQNLSWTDLKTRRKNSRLLCMFKILNELVEIPINDRLIPADRRTRGGHNQAYKHIRANTTLGQNSFWHRTIPDWNSLPAAATESKTVAAFKSQLVD